MQSGSARWLLEMQDAMAELRRQQERADAADLDGNGSDLEGRERSRRPLRG